MPSNRPGHYENQKNHKNILSRDYFEIGTGKAIGIVAASFLAGIGGSLWVRFSVAVSLPGRVDANETAIKKVEENYVKKEVSDLKWSENAKDHQNIEGKVNEVIKQIGVINADVKDIIKMLK